MPTRRLFTAVLLWIIHETWHEISPRHALFHAAQVQWYLLCSATDLTRASRVTPTGLTGILLGWPKPVRKFENSGQPATPALIYFTLKRWWWIGWHHQRVALQLRGSIIQSGSTYKAITLLWAETLKHIRNPCVCPYQTKTLFVPMFAISQNVVFGKATIPKLGVLYHMLSINNNKKCRHNT